MSAAAAGLLLSDDVAPPSIVQTRNIERSSDSVRPIHRHRSYVVRDDCYLLPTRTSSIPCFALSHEVPLCSASPPSFARQECPSFVTFNTILISLSPSRLRVGSLVVGSAAPSRIALPVFSSSQSEAGACSRALLLPPACRGGVLVLVPWALIRKVWLVDSTGSAPPTPPDIPLTYHSTPGLITVSALPWVWSTPGQEAARASVV